MSSPKIQAWNPEQYARNARFVSDLGMPVVELLSPQAGERILDLGCGDGALSVKLAELGCKLVCVDSSPEMIEAARSRGLNARVMDGRSLQFACEFDAVFSNAALHWMKEPERVIDGVRRALRPGGRFVAEFGGYGNVSKIINALESALASKGKTVACPWYFPRPAEYRRLLESAGFNVETMELFSRPTRLPGDVGDWLKTFAHFYTTVLPEEDRPDFVMQVVNELRGVLCDKEGNWTADYVRLRFSATKRNAGTAP